MFGLELDVLMHELWTHLETDQDGKSCDNVAFIGSTKDEAAERAAASFRRLVVKVLYECDENGYRLP